ncbi:ABC transporter permease [Alkalibacillus haloalkaliphilus]|uniref:ABC transporter permease n=1 Tax=Alkalibacillus haloalkaliphilus TaxID=94136 RepID=UPI0002D5962A|nr:ABC transporter permease subunit [Alkalibacillus haloalkaliphilus]
MQWQTIFKKELTEHWRSFKWIWVPIVFIIFAIMDPLTMYYFPIIMDTVGNVPEGATMDFPTPSVAEAMIMSFSQLGMLGVLIAVVVSMGLVSKEVKSGVYELVLSKPVSFTNYITAKYVAILMLIAFSLAVSLLVGWYYVNILFGTISFIQITISILFFIVYFMMILGIVMLFNSFLKSQGLVAFLSIITVVALNVISSIYSHVITWSPTLISDYINVYFYSGQLETEIWFSSVSAVAITVICLITATITLKNKAID